jgi:hypothetical protein
MHISLRTSIEGKEVGCYDSPVVPRTGEFVRLTDEAISALFRVVNVCYLVPGVQSLEGDLVCLEVMPENNAARIRLSEMLYQPK